MEELAGVILALIAAAMFVALVQGGWTGVKNWLTAKVLGHPVAGV